MLDNKGSLYIIDAVLAIILLLIVFLVINATVTMPTHEYSYESRDIKDAQDVMELLGGKIDFQDQSFLGEISEILKEGKNSKKSVSEVSEISKNKLNSYNLDNYKFTETNVLKDKVLASKGNYNNADNLSVATRTYGEYSYTLSIW